MTMKPPKLSIGMEEELFLVDPKTRYLLSDLPDGLFEECQEKFGKQIVCEFLACQLEIITKPCLSIHELAEEHHTLRRGVIDIAEKHNAAVLAVSTHPFSSWRNQHVNKVHRYKRLSEELKINAKRMLVTGMHLHVGFDEPNQRLDIMRKLKWYLPHLLALSTSSPFWRSIDTGLNSFRLNIIDNLPRSGLPRDFKDYMEYQKYIQLLTEVTTAEDSSELWWDARLSAKFPTVEMRITDTCTLEQDAMAIAALYQCLMRKLINTKEELPCSQQIYSLMIEENRWIAQNMPLKECAFIDVKNRECIPAETFYADLIEELEPYAKELGCLKELEHVYHIVEEGTSADRQRKVYNEACKAGCDETEAFKKVIDHLTKETKG